MKKKELGALQDSVREVPSRAHGTANNKAQNDLKALQNALAYMGHEHLAKEVSKLSFGARRELFSLNSHRLHTVKQKLELGIDP